MTLPARTSDPDVSIVIPTHDRPGLLQRSLASALTQRTKAAIEVIVVDDGSNPPVDAASDPAIVLIRTANLGAAAARNAGLDRARGRYVLFLDSDDWIEPDAVDHLLHAIEARNACAAFGAWRNVSVATGEASVIRLATPYADGLANAVAGGWVTGSFLMTRATTARFEPSLRVWEITTFLCESLPPGAPIAISDAVVVNIAQHEDPDRVSIRHDHFEPAATARAFAAMKAGLLARGAMNPDRLAALDGKLLACLHLLVRAGRAEAAEVYGSIDWSCVARQKSYRTLSFSWCARWGGIAGARLFTSVLKAFGR